MVAGTANSTTLLFRAGSILTDITAELGTTGKKQLCQDSTSENAWNQDQIVCYAMLHFFTS